MALGGVSASISRPAPPSHRDGSALLAGVRGVLLDGLGTLVALAPPWEALAADLLSDYGIELSAAEAQWAFAAEIDYYRAHHLEGRDTQTLADLRRRCAEVLHASLPPHAARALSLRQLTAAMLGALRFSVYPDALSALSLLRARGIGLVVVSNWDVSLAPTLGALGLGELLDAVVTSAGVGMAKPEPQVFQAALRLIDASPGEALHVGDDPELDVAGAGAAGVMPVLLRRQEASPAPAPAMLPRVTTISSLAELPGLI